MVPFDFSIPFVLSWGGSISLDMFLPSILLLVVIVVTVVIVTVILVFIAIVAVVIVVTIIGVVIVVMIIEVVVVVVVGGIPSIIKLSFRIIGSFSCYRSFTWPGVPVDKSVEEEDRKQTCFLGGNNSSGRKKSRGLNSGNGNTEDGDKIVDEVIGVEISWYNLPTSATTKLEQGFEVVKSFWNEMGRIGAVWVRRLGDEFRGFSFVVSWLLNILGTFVNLLLLLVRWKKVERVGGLKNQGGDEMGWWLFYGQGFLLGDQDG
nr:hypothetical protein [Tanacetum cinerariifolium]